MVLSGDKYWLIPIEIYLQEQISEWITFVESVKSIECPLYIRYVKLLRMNFCITIEIVTCQNCLFNFCRIVIISEWTFALELLICHNGLLT